VNDYISIFVEVFERGGLAKSALEICTIEAVLNMDPTMRTFFLRRYIGCEPVAKIALSGRLGYGVAGHLCEHARAQFLDLVEQLLPFAVRKWQLFEAYELLGVSDVDSDEFIFRRRKEMIKNCHPDKNGHQAPQALFEMQERAKQINVSLDLVIDHRKSQRAIRSGRGKVSGRR